MQHEAATDGVVSVSAGVAATETREAETIDLVTRADRALYRAKERGRDQVVNASWLLADPPFTPLVADERKRLDIHHS